VVIAVPQVTACRIWNVEGQALEMIMKWFLRLCTAACMLTSCIAVAQIHLSGALSGTLLPGEYLVDSTIVVENGTTLIIQPGARLVFTDWYPFKVNGTLIAEGTESDSIIFDCDPGINPNKWHGLRFTGAGASGSRLAYCRISRGKAQSYWPENSGGGIFCMSTAPTFEHCLISANTAVMYGGGAYCYNAPASFVDCVFKNNSCDSQGGGMYSSLSTLNLERCRFEYNIAGTAGGLMGISSGMTVTNCRFTNNSASTTGGIQLNGNPSATLRNCLVAYNSSTGS
jgi:hypothetical protein